MKILLVEDGEANIQSAKNQFPDHELTVVKTANEAEQIIGIEWRLAKYDLVLTDMYIPKSTERTELVPAGLTILAKCLGLGIPCAMVTDSNGHKCPLGAIIEKMNLKMQITKTDEEIDAEFAAQSAAKVEINDREILRKDITLDAGVYYCSTRPHFIETSAGPGKDWLGVVTHSGFGIIFNRLLKAKGGLSTRSKETGA
jgi:CheY-like chemotaxis protein